MAETYDNPHKVAPKQCSGNTPTWTDTTITADVTKVRKVHIDELRTMLSNEFTRRGLTTPSWTDASITANSTKIRNTHINELRTQYQNCKKGDCSADTLYCPQDTSDAASFTDTLTTNTVKPRKPHFDELRTKIGTLMTTCICEAEYCQYCADCGYARLDCSYGACCNEHQGGGCLNCNPNSWYYTYLCGSINLSSVTEHPYKAWDGTTATAWNGTVPWAMCNYGPPGSSWGTCEYQNGHNHSAWDCKCNPFGYA